MGSEQDDLLGLLAAADLRDDVGRMPRAADLVLQVEPDASAPAPHRATAPAAGRPRARPCPSECGATSPHVIVWRYKQIARAGRENEDRRGAMVDGRLHHLGAAEVFGEEILEGLHGPGADQNDRPSGLRAELVEVGLVPGTRVDQRRRQCARRSRARAPNETTRSGKENGLDDLRRRRDSLPLRRAPCRTPA